MTAGKPERRAAHRRRLWVPEVPEAFHVPDLPTAEAIPEAAATSAPTTPAGEAVTGSSQDGTVEVQVDLRGLLRHLRIDPAALRGPHPQRVGGAVVEAMNIARGRALRLTRQRSRR